MCVWPLCNMSSDCFLIYHLFLFYHTSWSKPFSVTLWPMISGLYFIIYCDQLYCDMFCDMWPRPLSRPTLLLCSSLWINHRQLNCIWVWSNLQLKLLTKYFAQPRKNFSEPSITMLWHFSGVDLQKGKLIHQHWIVPSKSQCSISLGS